MNSDNSKAWAGIGRRLGAVIFVLAASFSGGWLLSGNPPWHIETMTEYLTWAAGGAGIGVAFAEFGAVMKAITENDDWDSWSNAGKLFSAVWVVIVSASAMAV